MSGQEAQNVIDRAQADNDRQAGELQTQHNNAIRQQVEQCQRAVDEASRNDNQAAQDAANQGGQGGQGQDQQFGNIGGQQNQQVGQFSWQTPAPQINTCNVNGRTHNPGRFQMNQGGMNFNCNCNQGGSWNCGSQAAADEQNTMSVTSAVSNTPAWGIALFVVASLLVVAILAVIVQLTILLRRAKLSKDMA